MFEFKEWCCGVMEPLWAMEWTCHASLLDFFGNLVGHESPMWVDSLLLLLLL